MVLCVLPAAPSAAQVGSTARADTVVADAVVVADSGFLAGGAWRFVWGDHYRRTWATPVRVPFLDLQTFAGGLTPTRPGGGLQTRSLRFVGADGREYSFRSVNKDPSAILSDELKNTFAEVVLRDQISSQHPYGALVVDSILESVDVLHVDPRLFLMPDDPGLGQYREEFAGMLGLLEERPDENEGGAAFADAERVIGTERLFERVDESAKDRVDARAYLKARLVDIYVGDWDRHRDQWRWARLDGTDGWQPIPRDRDQAFARLDGLIPSMARFAVPQLVGFSDEYVSVFSVTWSGREMDRRFLAELERPVFDSLAADLQARLTDDVIDGAVARLPHEVVELDGEWIRSGLRARRDALPAAAGAFYEQLAHEVDLHASDDDELLVLSRTEEGRVALSLSTRDEPDRPYVRRVFSPDETEELRVRLHGGDDRVQVAGDASMPMTVRVVLGGGDDTIAFHDPTRGVTFYDERGDLGIEGRAPPDPDVRTRRYDEWEWSEENPAPRRDWGSVPLLQGDVGYSSDYGLLLGVGLRLIDYGFRRDPYHSSVRTVVSVSTTGKLEAVLEGEYWLEARPARFFFRSGGTQFDIVHYYPEGNDTPAPDPEAYYDVRRARVGVEVGFAREVAPGLELAGSGRLLGNFTADNADHFIGTVPDLYGAGTLWQTGLRAAARWRSGHAREGIRGTLAEVVLDASPEVLEVESLFGSMNALVRTYVPFSSSRISTLAFRVGGRKVWGSYPWFESAFLGGDDLRGRPAQRFGGDASLYGSAELRLQLGSAKVLLPELVGITLLADAGRVWVDGASPGGWHTGVGGGIWLALINDRNLVSAVYAVSEGGSGRLHIDWGFAF